MSGFRLERLVKAPLENVWAAADFRKPAGPFPMKVVNEGDPASYGKGFIRAVSSGKQTVLERLESVDPMRSYTYTLLEGVPVKPGYLGKVEFTPKGDDTRITWSASFRPKYPGTGWFGAFMIRMTVEKILDAIEADCRNTAPGSE